MQVDPIKPTLKAPGSKRSKLKSDELLSSFAFNFNLRRYNMVFASEEDAEERELFLTEQDEERPLDELEGGGAGAEVGPLAGKAWYHVTVCS